MKHHPPTAEVAQRRAVPEALQHLLTTPEVAQHLGVAAITLRKWRIKGIGPRFIRCGANIRYRLADIEAWVSSRTVSSTSEAA